MKTVAALFAGLCLTSCSAIQPKLCLNDPQVVRVPGATRYVAVDETLTEKTAAPATPVPLCVDAQGVPVLCDSQIGLWVRGYEAALGSCNADKQAIATLPVEVQ